MGILELLAEAEEKRLEDYRKSILLSGKKYSIKNPLFQEYLKTLERLADMDFDQIIWKIQNSHVREHVPISIDTNFALQKGIIKTVFDFNELLSLEDKPKPYGYWGNLEYPQHRKSIYQLSNQLDTIIARCGLVEGSSKFKLITDEETNRLIEKLKESPKSIEYEKIKDLGGKIRENKDPKKFTRVYNLLK